VSNTVISAENLGKRYIIEHQNKRTQQDTLRDVITDRTKQLAKRVLRPMHGIGINQNQEEFWALRDVAFEIKQGDRVGVIGRNGAGKSTLLKILSRITEPTVGQVTLNGRVASLLEVGTGFHPELTGRENIYLNGTILGMSRAEVTRKFDEIVAFAEVEKFIDTPVKRYSSGMYVRLAFAVAAHLEPEILIVDEVLAVGDVQFQKKCLGKMESVASEGRTILFVSHNISAVRNLCKTAILMNQGRLERQGEVSEVLRYYLQDEVAVEASNEIDPPKDQNVPGYAVRVTVEDEFGQPAIAPIPVGRPWQVRIHFKVTKPIPHFVMGLGMCSSEDLPLRTCWSAPQDIEPGNYQFVFREEEIVLGTGRYWFIVGLSGSHQTFHYVERAGALEMADYSEGGNFVRVSKVGFLLNPMESYLLDAQGQPTALTKIG
jgi:lipopolysaccharide transport system ATP-binding protein